jgi:hypothetical protein
VVINKLGSLYICFLSLLAWTISLALFTTLFFGRRTERAQLVVTLAVAQSGGHAPPSIYCGGVGMSLHDAQDSLQALETNFPTGRKFAAAVCMASLVTIIVSTIEYTPESWICRKARSFFARWFNRQGLQKAKRVKTKVFACKSTPWVLLLDVLGSPLIAGHVWTFRRLFTFKYIDDTDWGFGQIIAVALWLPFAGRSFYLLFGQQ